jgi:phosphonate C-P lyase system protein PhnG
MILGSSVDTAKSSFDFDQIICECELEPLQTLVSEIELRHKVMILQHPSICLTMIPAEDSLEKQKFYLGEALTTECEVLVDQLPGYGLCLGDEPVRTYCVAVIDALLHNGQTIPLDLDTFFREQRSMLERRQQDEFDLILQTQVDFKLMEEK